MTIMPEISQNDTFRIIIIIKRQNKEWKIEKKSANFFKIKSNTITIT